jgi:hypothetical protein
VGTEEILNPSGKINEGGENSIMMGFGICMLDPQSGK